MVGIRDPWFVRQQRMSRRGFVQGTAAGVGGVAALGTIGCGDDDDDTQPTSVPGGSTQTATQPSEVKRGGISKSYSLSVSDTFDPHTSVASAAIFCTYIQNRLLAPTKDGEIAGELAEEWEVPGDGTELLLKIRPGVTWHDKFPMNGRAFTGEDAVFNLMRITAKLNPDRAAQFHRRTALPNFDSAEAIDDSTVSIKLSAPHSAFFRGLTDVRNTLVAPDYVEQVDKWDLGSGAEIPGTGPWVCDRFENNVAAKFSANPSYFVSGRPYLDGHEYVFYGDTLAAYAGFGQGQVDYMWAIGPSVATRESIEKLARSAEKFEWSAGIWNHLRFNISRSSFSDQRVRRAIFLALDYKELNDGYFGDGGWVYTGPGSIVFPEAIPSDEIAQREAYNSATKDADRQAAVQLLSSAGHADGSGVSFTIMPSGNPATGAAGPHYDTALRIIDQLKSVFPDIDVALDLPADTGAFGQRSAAGDFDSIVYFVQPAGDLLVDLTAQYHSTGSRNYGKYADDRVDALLEQAVGELDLDARAETLRDVQELLLEEVPMIVHSVGNEVIWAQPKVKGMFDSLGNAGNGSALYAAHFATTDMWLDA